MLEPSLSIRERAARYCIARGLSIKDELGAGKDGTVYSTQAATALKIFVSAGRFENERDCYQRLADTETMEVLGHNVPAMLNADESLLAIEMTLVQSPFLLDFAGAQLDREPDFSDDVLDTRHQAKAEEFGPHWSRVQVIIQVLWDRCGIYMVDVHPGNIAFDDA